jgi:hypothetical protein
MSTKELPQFGDKFYLPHYCFTDMQWACTLPVVEVEAMIVKAKRDVSLVYIGDAYGFQWRTVKGLWFISSAWWGGKDGKANAINEYVLTGRGTDSIRQKLKQFLIKQRTLQPTYALLDNDVEREEWFYTTQEERSYQGSTDYRRYNQQWVARYAPNWRQAFVSD